LPAGYRKKTVTINVTDGVTPHSYFWDGGSRTEWVHYRNGKRQPIKLPGYPFNERAEQIVIDAENIVVSGGTFMGKQASVTFYVSEYNHG